MAQEAALGDTTLSEAQNDAAYEHLKKLQLRAFGLRASTLDGAMASLEWARRQFAAEHVNDPVDADWHDRFVLGLLDSALGVMRSVTGAPAAQPLCPVDLENAVLDLRCDLVVIEALLSEALPQEDAAGNLGVARQPHHQIAPVPHDARRAFIRAVDTLRVNLGTLSRVSGVGDMLA